MKNYKVREIISREYMYEIRADSPIDAEILVKYGGGTALHTKELPPQYKVLQGIGHKNALIVVDMLEDFISYRGAMYVPNSEKFVGNINKLIYETSKNGGLIIFANDAHYEDDPEFSEFPPHAIKGSFGAEIYWGIKIAGEYEIVEKQTFDAFTNEELDEILGRHGIRKIYVCGVTTEICIKATAKSAVELGYDVVIVKNTVKGLNEKESEKALAELKTIGVEVCE